MRYDVIVVGGGHAGLEAALAAARLGSATLLVTQKISTLGVLSCNPAFGGPAKGGLVREVDALGGPCGFLADLAARQCRVLGESKGPAARATRALVDRNRYRDLALAFARHQKNLTLVEGEAIEALARNGRADGLTLADGREFFAGALVLTGGTFWRGLVFHGPQASPGGRAGEAPAVFLSQSLARLGHRLGRLSTNTAPRLAAASVDYRLLTEQPGDPAARPFSVLHEQPGNSHSCWLAWTNPETHRLVNAGAHTSAPLSGAAPGAGPRYCPSIEDKVRRFPERERHQVFIEPDEDDLIYPSGLTTGLAPGVQLALLRSMKGLARAEIVRPGYAVEYDFVPPDDLWPSLESKKLPGLFLAGQINGTSGYEEAAAQGLLAGLNAARRAAGLDPVILARSEALLGVLADDLSGQGVTEPYRMFTSRAEWRLLLREDNADLRLSPLAERWGLLDAERARRLRRKQDDLARGRRLLAETKITPAQARDLPAPDLALKETATLAELLKRPALRLEHCLAVLPALAELGAPARLTLETEVKFAGYIKRQEEEVARQAREEHLPIPPNLDFSRLAGLSAEARELLAKHRPATLGQAGRLAGLTPAAVTVLGIHLKKR